MMAGAFTSFDVTTQGVPKLLDRLKGFEDDVYKALQTDIKTAADAIGATARGLLPGEPPTSHWAASGRFAWDAGKVRGGIKPSMRTRRVAGTRVVWALVRSTNAAANLFMATGSKDNSRLGSLVAASYGSTYPRALGPAWTMKVDQARKDIQDAIDRAAAKVNRG